MKKTLTAATILATLITRVSHADTFDFSYKFSSPDSLTPSFAGSDILTGSFMGIFNPSTDLISNISNFQASLDGVAFSAPLIGVGWSTATTTFDDAIAPVISPKATLNNFAFADVDLAVNQQWNYGLAFVNDPNAGGQTILAYNGNIQDSSGTQLSVSDSPVNATWEVTDVSSVRVPIPTGMQMILAAGLGLLSTAARRRLFAK